MSAKHDILMFTRETDKNILRNEYEMQVQTRQPKLMMASHECCMFYLAVMKFPKTLTLKTKPSQNR